MRSIDLAKGHVIQRVIFWPERWKQFNPPASIAWNWRSVPFEKNSSSSVPNDKHGLYSFILCPRVASHPENHFVLYIGKADSMTLRERFRSYFQDMKRVKRPQISYVLTKYAGYLEFCFTPVDQRDDIEGGEQSLLTALIPPFNTSMPGEVSAIVRGLR
jgi:hypothetical protein